MTPTMIIGLLFALALTITGVLLGLAFLGLIEADAPTATAVGAFVLKLLDRAVAAIRTRRGRTVADGPLEDDSAAPGPKGDGGFTRIGLLSLVLVLSACGSLVLSQGHVRIEPLNKGAGAVVVVTDTSGTEAARVEVVKLAAPVKIPGSLLCSTLRGVLESYSGGDKRTVSAWLKKHTKCVQQ